MELDAATRVKSACYENLRRDRAAKPNPSDHDWPVPLALVMGSELDDFPADVAARCSRAVGIPLYGINSLLGASIPFDRLPGFGLRALQDRIA